MKSHTSKDISISDTRTIELGAISIVIVLYFPTKEDINNIIHISQLGYNLVVVDNSNTTHEFELGIYNIEYIFNGENQGIAKALNTGIKKAIKQNKDGFIILLDQDSRISDNYPLEIAKEYNRISKHIHLSALGPKVIQKTTKEVYTSFIHKEKPNNYHFLPQKDIITSGCCISKDVIEKIGFFDEILFIDFVDTEWCYRANHLGLTCGITTNLNISHMIGLGELRIGKHIVTLSAPTRYYYIYRNYIFLCLRKYVPHSYKINFGIKLFLRFFYLPFFIEHSLLCWKSMISGIKDGISAIFTHK